ncbi:aminoacyl-histidine dipeptidase [Lutispora sp.]|uniref:aminoacyl-histidine dipeptidase n=1 Tax=Lutispora sp. TaxID=2828727 RepID=UPI002B20B08E|nr:aminoacyl-histidine dipeptidase [Lutispora sp.]MEA4964099.1 aminoacyl-histidine dipeptidase [Lutispora sp.]
MDDVLKYSKVLNYFKEISKIPRESGNEAGISNYLVNMAKTEGWQVFQDESYNVLIKKPASEGYENAPVVLLQGHMDMVCEKSPGVVHDFQKDPIKLNIVDDFIYADGTTLGADNGIGMAMCLAVLKDDELEHPPLEVLFTTGEEKGMKGVQALDGNKFKSSILINLDSEGEGVFTAGCAGALRIALHLPLRKEKIYDKQSYRIIVCGLKGGHSGDDIDKGRGNANKILGRLLLDIKDYISLCSIKGGTKENVIPSEAEAAIASKNEDILKEKIDKWNEILKKEFLFSDPDAVIKLEKCCNINEAFNEDTKCKIIKAINMLPNGVNTKNHKINLVISSSNMAVIDTETDRAVIRFSIRSSIKSNIYDDLAERIRMIADILGFEYEEGSSYPGWEYSQNSYIRELCMKAYEEVTGEKAYAEAIHAGLECGYLMEKISNLDAVSFGPQLYDIHTPNEHVVISSIEKTYNLLCEVLKKIR